MSQHSSDTMGLTVLKGIGDVKGDWIDVIWEPGRPNPNMLTHIKIREEAGEVHIKGISYSADNVNGDTPLKAAGDFSSKHVALLAGRDGFSYQYTGREYRDSGPSQLHSGVGFYEFRKDPDERQSFEGSFLVHEARISRYVQGERISLGEKGILDDPTTRTSLRNFLISKKRAPLFEKSLEEGLQPHVGPELLELTANYEAKNPYATAFLLRRILEKLLFLAFLNNGEIKKIRMKPNDVNSRLKGLKEIIGIAKSTAANGVPILTDETAKGIQGAKYSGDMAAHGPTPFIVDMNSINSSMAFTRGAWSELLAKIPSPKTP